MHDSEDEDSLDDSDNETDENSDDGPDTDDLAHLPTTPASLPFCTCGNERYPHTADDLGDNGRFVTYRQRKMWERWVVKRCPEHSLT